MALSSLPKFSGEDPESWICYMEEFFCNSPIPFEQYVSIGSQHLIGVAQVWFTNNQHKFAMDWCGFVYHLLGEFEKSELFEARFKSASVKTMMDDGPANKEGDAISDTQTCVSSVLLQGNESSSTPEEESIAASSSLCYQQISSSIVFGQDQDFQTPKIHTKNGNNIHAPQMFDDMHKEELLKSMVWNYKAGSILYMNFYCVRYDDFVTEIEVPIAWNIYDVKNLLKVLIPQTRGLEVVTYELLSLDNVAVMPHSSPLVAFNYCGFNRSVRVLDEELEYDGSRPANLLTKFCDIARDTKNNEAMENTEMEWLGDYCSTLLISSSNTFKVFHHSILRLKEFKVTLGTLSMIYAMENIHPFKQEVLNGVGSLPIYHEAFLFSPATETSMTVSSIFLQERVQKYVSQTVLYSHVTLHRSVSALWNSFIFDPGNPSALYSKVRFCVLLVLHWYFVSYSTPKSALFYIKNLQVELQAYPVNTVTDVRHFYFHWQSGRPLASHRQIDIRQYSSWEHDLFDLVGLVHDIVTSSNTSSLGYYPSEIHYYGTAKAMKGNEGSRIYKVRNTPRVGVGVHKDVWIIFRAPSRIVIQLLLNEMSRQQRYRTLTRRLAGIKQSVSQYCWESESDAKLLGCVFFTKSVRIPGTNIMTTQVHKSVNEMGDTAYGLVLDAQSSCPVDRHFSNPLAFTYSTATKSMSQGHLQGLVRKDGLRHSSEVVHHSVLHAVLKETAHFPFFDLLYSKYKFISCFHGKFGLTGHDFVSTPLPQMDELTESSQGCGTCRHEPMNMVLDCLGLSQMDNCTQFKCNGAAIEMFLCKAYTQKPNASTTYSLTLLIMLLFSDFHEAVYVISFWKQLLEHRLFSLGYYMLWLKKIVIMGYQIAIAAIDPIRRSILQEGMVSYNYNFIDLYRRLRPISGVETPNKLKHGSAAHFCMLSLCGYNPGGSEARDLMAVAQKTAPFKFLGAPKLHLDGINLTEDAPILLVIFKWDERKAWYCISVTLYNRVQSEYEINRFQCTIPGWVTVPASLEWGTNILLWRGNGSVSCVDKKNSSRNYTRRPNKWAQFLQSLSCSLYDSPNVERFCVPLEATAHSLLEWSDNEKATQKHDLTDGLGGSGRIILVEITQVYGYRLSCESINIIEAFDIRFFDPGIVNILCSVAYISEFDCLDDTEWLNSENFSVIGNYAYGCSYGCYPQKLNTSHSIVRVTKNIFHDGKEAAAVYSSTFRGHLLASWWRRSLFHPAGAIVSVVTIRNTVLWLRGYISICKVCASKGMSEIMAANNSLGLKSCQIL